MRNLDRIIPIIKQVAKLWYKHPDLRFFQFIIVIAEQFEKETGINSFYIEDDILLKCLEKANEI